MFITKLDDGRGRTEREMKMKNRETGNGTPSLRILFLLRVVIS